MARKRIPLGCSGHTLLVVDDQEEICLITRLLLEGHGYQALTATDGEEALTLFQPGQIDLVIVDYCMPGMSGEEVIQAIRVRDALVPILLQTGYSGMQAPEELFSTLDIQGYHDKLAGPDQLLIRVDTELKAASRKHRKQKTQRGQIPAMRLPADSAPVQPGLFIVQQAEAM